MLRRKYLLELHELTGRNVIIYYSGWLQKSEKDIPNSLALNLDDNDKNGFMAAIHNLDRSKGLDLFLHTPGGSTAATESLVDYLRSMFGTDIRAIIPQLAMSAGTMVACACNEILMGKHSSIGPIDPQLGGMAAHGVLEEFRKAAEEIQQDPSKVAVWQFIIAKYQPTLIGECQKAIDWSNEMVKQWLMTGMFKDDDNAEQKANRIVAELGDHLLTKSHDRHISMDRAREIGLNIVAWEDDDALQEAVLTVHHACIQTLTATPAYKIIENHNGVAFIQAANSALIRLQ
jgi:ClpP class serine protease